MFNHTLIYVLSSVSSSIFLVPILPIFYFCVFIDSVRDIVRRKYAWSGFYSYFLKKYTLSRIERFVEFPEVLNSRLCTIATTRGVK